MRYKPGLSILIPTLTTREHYFNRVIDQLESQLYDPITGNSLYECQVIALPDNGELSTGAKRNCLLSLAEHEYSVFIDDDDTLADNYLSVIFHAMTTKPDVITFNIDRYQDDQFYAHESITLKNKKRVVDLKDPVFQFRYPYMHICPVLTRLTKLVSFKPVTKNEDLPWVDDILYYIKSETHIDKVLYYYNYRTNRKGEVSHIQFSHEQSLLEQSPLEQSLLERSLLEQSLLDEQIDAVFQPLSTSTISVWPSGLHEEL